MNTIEKKFNAFVEEFGGELVSRLVGSSPGFDNADYLFDRYRVIAELKTLDEDKLLDPRFIDKTSRLYEEAHRNGGTQVVVFGTVRMSASEFTPECQERLMKLCEQPIRDAVKKANRQIRQTKEHLKRADYKGVLIVVNENNTALAPIIAVELLHRILARPHYSSIDNAVFFTVNLRATHVSKGGDFMTWVSILRYPEDDEAFERFESALRNSWHEYLARKLGVFPVIRADDEFLGSLRNRLK